MKKNTRSIIVSLLLTIAFTIPAHQVNAQDASAYDLIAQVNAVRTSTYGLSPLETDGALMASAQAHAEYMASTGSCSHTGAGGTSAKQRMINAGYGGGATVWGTENIYCGGRSVSEVVTWWQGDYWHLLPYKEASYRSIGGGIATGANNQLYFVIDVAYTSGGSSGGSTTSSGTSVANSGSVSSTAVAAQRVVPIVTATLLEDGSQIHEVKQGQTYWGIGTAYGMTAAEIKRLNGISSNSTVLSIGQKLLIHGAYTATPIQSETPTPEPATQTSTITQTATITLTPTSTGTPTPKPLFEGASGMQNIDRRGLGIGLVVICVVGLGLMVVGGMRKKKNTPDDDYDPLNPPIDSL